MSNPTPSDPGAMPGSGAPAMGTNQPSGATPPTSGQLTLEQALAKLAELENANKNAVEERDRHRKKLTAYEDAERKAQEASLSEIDKAKKGEAAALEQVKAYQRQLAVAQIKIAAQGKGIINPDLVADAIQSKLEYDKDTGMPTNLDKMLDQLVKDNPYLVRAQTPAPPQGNNANTPPVPQIPAMNPGRASIQPPATNATPGKPPRLNQIKWSN